MLTNEPRPRARRWKGPLLLGLCGVLVFLGWCAFETLEVYRAQPNPAVDSRKALRALAEQAAGTAPEAADEAWRLLRDVLDATSSVVDEINDRYAAGEFEQRDEYDSNLWMDRVRAGPVLPADPGMPASFARTCSGGRCPKARA